MQTFPESPYYEGRWSNGPTWIEVVASSLGISLTDYGAGGATTGSAPARMCLACNIGARMVPVPSVRCRLGVTGGKAHAAVHIQE